MRSVLAAAFAFALSVPAAANPTIERVTFPTLDPAFKGELQATIYRPAEGKRNPAMILLSGCLGISRSTLAWAEWFSGKGYEAIVLDSLGPRHVEDVCDGGYPSEGARAYDAYAALAFLRTRPDVDVDRVGVIGWSHGGGAVLIADDTRFATTIAGTKFRAAIAFYPDCESMPAAAVSAPLLIFTGGQDDWTPPEQCTEVAKRLAHAGQPVAEHRYPFATHGFDSVYDPGVLNLRGQVHHIRYNGAAVGDARARITVFLDGAMR
ncbi:MAG: dienelactone hydrolase family protein [Candidatus Eremiobacteraeota bacterium]|nr:dienelactone hydrolase family protein [Candidatus Eremiobacteraeota bacterium]